MSTNTKVSEIWKSIKDYEGFYEVSTFGNVRSLDRYVKYHDDKRNQLIKGRVLKNTVLGGYVRITLCNNQKRKNKYIHRLVMETFIPESNKNLEVNHIDENPLNNHISNLEWCTRLENIRHGTAIERKAKKLLNGKKSKPINKIDLDGKIVKWYPSISQARREGYRDGYICDCLKGRKEIYKGYKWEYAN